MTASNGNTVVAEPSNAEISVRIRSSAYLLGNYEMKAKMPGQIQRDFINLVLTAKETDYMLCLSFKHIVRIDLLDNSENEGAGAIIYLNNFMAKSIERLFHFEPNSFLNFKNPYMDHAFIVLDILNSDKATIAMLKKILDEAAEFHRNYLLMRFKAENDPDAESKLPKQFIWPITSQYWKSFLNTMHKEFFVEEVTIGSNDGKDITYASGYMINSVSTNKCAVQSDGRIMPVNSEQQDSLMTIRRRAPDHLQPRTFALGRLQQADGPPPKMPRYVTTTQQILRPKIDEVHTIDDDQAVEPTHTADDTLVAKYDHEGKMLCKVYESDLATLGPSEMLNDTIVDFYMNYILHDILPKERRDEIYVFNSFFYTKLSKGLGPKTQSSKARSKKIAENFSMLKNWTKNVNIFSKNYIVVPINEDTHWYLAVIVNPSIGFVTSKENGSLDSPANGNSMQPTNAPEVPVFIFDSLLEVDAVKKHRPVAELLLEYLFLEYRDKKNEHQLQGVAYRKNACRVIIPDNTPQQQNHYDCGVFMLQFAETFLSKAPKFDEIPASTTIYEQLFGNIDLEGKREFIRKLISDLSTNSNRLT